jgi:hypothetical protein
MHPGRNAGVVLMFGYGSLCPEISKAIARVRNDTLVPACENERLADAWEGLELEVRWGKEGWDCN